MNNVIYTGVIIPAKESADGESPTTICVTQEANGLAIWRSSYEEGTVCVKHELYACADRYLEEAVGMVQRERAMVKKGIASYDKHEALTLG
jgi:hypothetical protein